jgi:hypothetical protein
MTLLHEAVAEVVVPLRAVVARVVAHAHRVALVVAVASAVVKK